MVNAPAIPTAVAVINLRPQVNCYDSSEKPRITSALKITPAREFIAAKKNGEPAMKGIEPFVISLLKTGPNAT